MSKNKVYAKPETTYSLPLVAVDVDDSVTLFVRNVESITKVSQSIEDGVKTWGFCLQGISGEFYGVDFDTREEAEDLHSAVLLSKVIYDSPQPTVVNSSSGPGLDVYEAELVAPEQEGGIDAGSKVETPEH